MRKILIIGGGASGMMAAIAASRCGASVTILEHTDRIGKKILSTGNGKCNYTNRKQGVSCYRGENPAFVLPIFKRFGMEDTVKFFLELGIYPKERNGYFYPASEQAASVLDVLRMELERLSVSIVTSCEITSVNRNKKGFCISTNQGKYYSDACIIACGLRAFPKSGSDGSAIPLIKAFGHTIVPIVPALVQIAAKQSFFKSIAGIRSDISVSLFVDDVFAASDRGEVQLTEYGISGIPTFQISRFASRALYEKRKVHAVLDFVPYLSEEELYQELERRFLVHGAGKNCEQACIGMFSKKLIPVFLKETNISLKQPANQLSKENLHELTNYIKHMTIDITGTKGFDAAQVCAGGVSTEELSQTMESKFVSGLYFVGEVVDIDGICGGYNLQWAWSSGFVAGEHAANQK